MFAFVHVYRLIGGNFNKDCKTLETSLSINWKTIDKFKIFDISTGVIVKLYLLASAILSI